jgi:hypothetical protein
VPSFKAARDHTIGRRIGQFRIIKEQANFALLEGRRCRVANAVTSTLMPQCVVAALRIVTVIEQAGRQPLSAVNPEFPRWLGR